MDRETNNKICDLVEALYELIEDGKDVVSIYVMPDHKRLSWKPMKSTDNKDLTDLAWMNWAYYKETFGGD